MRAMVCKINEIGFESLQEVDVKSYKDYYELIGCSCFDIVMIEYQGHKLSVYCDDEGMLKSGNFGRVIGSYPNPIFGSIVITGGADEEGNTLGLPDELTMLDIYKIIGEVQWVVK